jgi:hypothetical protein
MSRGSLRLTFCNFTQFCRGYNVDPFLRRRKRLVQHGTRNISRLNGFPVSGKKLEQRRENRLIKALLIAIPEQHRWTHNGQPFPVLRDQCVFHFPFHLIVEKGRARIGAH